MRERLTGSTVKIKSDWAVSSGNTGGSVPFSSFGAGVLGVNALCSIEEFPRLAEVSGVGADAECSIIVGVRWARNVHTAVAIPTFTSRARRISTNSLRSQINKADLADTPVVQGIISLS